MYVMLYTMKRRVNSLSDMMLCANHIYTMCVPQGNRATLVTMTGELGAGKTTLTQYIAKKMGVKEIVHSPTFVLYKRYKTLPPFTHLIHIDLYRIEKEELPTIQFEKLITEPNTLIIIEWGEKITDIPVDIAIKVQITEKGRIVEYNE